MIWPLGVAAGAAGAALARSRAVRATYAVVAIVLAVALLPALRPAPPAADGPRLRVYAKNLLASNGDTAGLADDILAADVDVALLQEVSDRNRTVLMRLRRAMPHQHLCRFSSWSAIAIASRHPFDGPASCSVHRAVAAAPLRLPAGRVWVASVHLPWPWPLDSAANDAAALELLARIAADGRPIVLGGDFNVLPWSPRFQRIARLTGTRPAGPPRCTYRAAGLPLPIDAVLAPGGGRTSVRPHLGSDHLGLVATVALADGPA